MSTVLAPLRHLLRPSDGARVTLRPPTETSLHWSDGEGEHREDFENPVKAWRAWRDRVSALFAEGYTDAEDRDEPGVAYRREGGRLVEVVSLREETPHGVTLVYGSRYPQVEIVRWCERGRVVRELRFDNQDRLSRDIRYGETLNELRHFYLVSGRDFLHFFETPDGQEVGVLRCWRSDGSLAKRMDFADASSPFVPDAEEEPACFLNDSGRRWEIWPPWESEVRERSQGRPEKVTTCRNNDAAVKKWRRLIAARQKKGFRREAPWRHLSDGERVFSVRPPVNRFLCTRWDREAPEWEDFERHEAAIEAFNEAVLTRRSEGFEVVEEPVFVGLPLTAAGYVRLSFWGEPGAFLARRENFIRRRDFSDERQFGPGVEYYSDGDVVVYEQMADTNEGWNRLYGEDGTLQTLTPYLGGESEGVVFTLHPDGRIQRCELHVGGAPVAEEDIEAQPPQEDPQLRHQRPPSEERLEALRKLLRRKPTRKNWLLIGALLEAVAREEDGLEALLAAVEARLVRWPARVRMAPLPWAVGLVTGVLPLSLLRVTSALSLAPVLYGASHDSPHYAALKQWIATLPDDAPAQSGLHLGLRLRHQEPIDAACAAAADDLKPVAFEYEVMHLETELLDALLRSPLARALEVLDISMDIPNEDVFGGSQDTLFGRWFRLGEVVKALQAPEKLVSLDLHGQLNNTGEIARTIWRGKGRLPALRALNLGGSHPVNTRDVKALVSVLRGSPLEALHIAPNQSIEGMSVDFDDFEEAYTAREYWNIYNKEDLETDAGAIKQLLAALPGLKRLVLPALYEADPGYQQVLADRGGLAVEFRSYIRLGWRGPFEADWEAHFEW